MLATRAAYWVPSLAGSVVSHALSLGRPISSSYEPATPNAARTIPKLAATNSTDSASALPSDSASTRPEKPYAITVVAIREALKRPECGCRKSSLSCAMVRVRIAGRFMPY